MKRVCYYNISAVKIIFVWELRKWNEVEVKQASIIMQTDLPMRGHYMKWGVADEILVIDVSPVANEQLCMLHMTILTRLEWEIKYHYIYVSSSNIMHVALYLSSNILYE